MCSSSSTSVFDRLHTCSTASLNPFYFPYSTFYIFRTCSKHILSITVLGAPYKFCCIINNATTNEKNQFNLLFCFSLSIEHTPEITISPFDSEAMTPIIQETSPLAQLFGFLLWCRKWSILHSKSSLFCLLPMHWLMSHSCCYLFCSMKWYGALPNFILSNKGKAWISQLCLFIPWTTCCVYATIYTDYLCIYNTLGTNQSLNGACSTDHSWFSLVSKLN